MKIKNVIIKIVLIVICIAIIGNISSQMTVLLMANKKTKEVENRMNELVLEKELLIKKNELATSSAMMEIQARRKLGMGKEQDRWIIVEEKKISPIINSDVVEEGARRKVEEWIRVFTGK